MEQNWRTVDQAKLYYEDSETKGEILICIHGFMSSSICWHRLIPHLAKKFRIITVDLPGFGKSMVGADFEYTLQNYGRTIIQFIQSLGLSSVHVVGHSLGGQIALQAVYQEPKLFKKLFLISASAERKRPLWLARLFCHLPLVDEAAYRFYFQDKMVDVAIAKILSGGAGLEDHVLRPYIDMCKKREVVKAVLKLGIQREDDMSATDIETIENETYLLWGRDDEVVLLEEGEFLHKHLKNSHLAIIEHCGHLPMEEYPTHVLHHFYSFFQPNYLNLSKMI